MDIIWQSILDAILKGAGDLMNVLSSLSLDIFDDTKFPFVAQVIAIFTYIGWIMIATGILFAIAQTAINYSEDGILEYHKVIINIFYSILAVLALAPGAEFVFVLGVTIQRDISGSVTGSYVDILDRLENNMRNPAPSTPGAALPQLSTLWILIIMIILLVCLFIIFFQTLKRSGLYLIQIFVGYMHLFSIPLGNYDSFLMWIRMTFSLAVTNIIQMSILIIGLKLVVMSDFMSIMFGIGILIACTDVERVAQMFGFQVNSSHAFRTVGSSINQSVHLVKNLKKLRGG